MPVVVRDKREGGKGCFTLSLQALRRAKWQISEVYPRARLFPPLHSRTHQSSHSPPISTDSPCRCCQRECRSEGLWTPPGISWGIHHILQGTMHDEILLVAYMLSARFVLSVSILFLLHYVRYVRNCRDDGDVHRLFTVAKCTHIRTKKNSSSQSIQSYG